MVDVATVSSAMPSALQVAAATPTSIDAMFGALLQQITDGQQLGEAQLGANISTLQAQTIIPAQASLATDLPSNAQMMALIQNASAISFGSTNQGMPPSDAVAVMPAASVQSDDTTTTAAALLSLVTAQQTGAMADKTGTAAGDVHQILPGLMLSAAQSTTASSASAAAGVPPMPMLANSETVTASKDIDQSNQASGDAETAAFNAIATLFSSQWTPFLQQQPQSNGDAVDADIGNETASTAVAIAQTAGDTFAASSASSLAPESAAASQPTIEPFATKGVSGQAPTTAATVAPVATQTESDRLADTRASGNGSTPAVPQTLAPKSTETTAMQQRTAAAGQNDATVTPLANVAEPAIAQPTSDQGVLVTDATNAANNDSATKYPEDAAATEATSDSLAAQATGQTVAQTVMATALATPIQPTVAVAPTASPATSSEENALTGVRLAAATTGPLAGQANRQATQSSGADNKTDLKNKNAQAGKAQSTSGTPAESGLATGTDSEIGSDAQTATQPVETGATKSVQPDTGRATATPVSQEKATADTSTLPQAPAPLATVDPASVTAKVQVTAQRIDSDSDTVSTLDKLGMTIAARSAEGLHHFDIRLDPAELGRVQVRLTVDDTGQAQATIVADKQQTLDMLQRDSSSLNRALQDAGLSLSNNGLNFSLREQHQQNEASGQNRRRSLSAAAVLSTEASQSRSSQGSYAPNSVRLDIRV